MRKKHGPLRADTVAHSMNAAKESFVLDFIRDYRDVAVQIGRAQWRLFFETGSTNKQASAKHLNDICGAAPVQMASYQVQEQIDGWISNRANEFVDCVRGSKLPDAAKKQLYTINRRQLWFCREAIDGIDSDARALARSIMRHCMGNHRHPDLSRISPRRTVCRGARRTLAAARPHGRRGDAPRRRMAADAVRRRHAADQARRRARTGGRRRAMTATLATRTASVSDPLPSIPFNSHSPAPTLRPETPLSEPQQLALLTMRRSELSEAVLKKLHQAGTAKAQGRHFYELARLNLAEHRYHVLTPKGRFAADRLALETARQLGMHIVTYNFGRPGSAARAYCTCGWSTFRSRAVGNYAGMLARDAHHHRLHVEQQNAAFERTVAAVGKVMAARPAPWRWSGWTSVFPAYRAA